MNQETIVLMKMAFLVNNSFVYIVYTYTFNIMICDKKKNTKYVA